MKSYEVPWGPGKSTKKLLLSTHRGPCDRATTQLDRSALSLISRRADTMAVIFLLFPHSSVCPDPVDIPVFKFLGH